jgi:two-component system phosphate regulon sensor histidine kinase PhoR
MSKKHLYIILFIVAIVGLSFIQYQYFRIGLNLAGVQFNQNMGDAVKEIKEDLSQKNELTFLVGSAITKEASNFKLSLDSVQDAAAYFLDDYLQEKLLQHGIKTGYGFSIYKNDSISYLQSKTVFDDEKLLKYPIGLEGYLPDLMSGKLTLELQFKNVNRYFLSQLNGLTIPSIIFLIIIIVVILWVYRSFYLQKNLITSTNEFINNLTHELRTPVFSIGVATKILEEKDHQDERELVTLIRKQVDRLKGQIDKVLELGIIEGKKGFVKRKAVDLHPILQDLALDFEQLSKLENFEFKSEIQGEGYWVLADVYHLENAVNGLLENAKKYTKENTLIKLMAYIDRNFLVIEVSDNGIGIDSQDQQKIFEKYYRVTDGDLHNVKGYGLGLNYVKRIVNLHKGKIEVKSAIHEGSTFIIKIPLIKNDGK